MPFQRGEYGVGKSHRVAFVKLTHIHVQCKDEDGNVMAGRRYKITLPRAGVVEAELDDDGWAKHDDIYPGDVSFQLFPEEPETEDENQTISTAAPQVYHLRLRFEDEDGDPFVNKPFSITADGGYSQDGVTDAKGKLIADVPATVEEGEITIWLDEDKSGESYTWPIRISEVAR